MNRCSYRCVNKPVIDQHLSIGFCSDVLKSVFSALKDVIGVVYARFVQPPAIIHLLNKVYKSSVVDQLLLVFCDNVCIQIFSAVFCVTLNFTADISKLASTLE